LPHEAKFRPPRFRCYAYVDLFDFPGSWAICTTDAECPDRGSEMGVCIEVLSDNEPNSASDIEECMELNILDDDFDLGANILT